MNILCVTPNVAIDRVLKVPGFTAGGVWRASAAQVSCGGKGVNVARALRRLGHAPTCAGLVGGESGCRAADAARAEGLAAAWTWIDGETRSCVVIVDERGFTTVVNEPGPAVSEDDWHRFAADVGAAARENETVCICGSLPPGAPLGALTRLVNAAAQGGRSVWVDTAGAALADALCAGPTGIKINAGAAANLLGEPVETIAAAARAASGLRERCGSYAAVTLGAAGAVLAGPDGIWTARPPELAPVNAAGSGDTFLAGLLAGLADGLAAPEALRFAAAAGAANTQSLGLGDIEATMAGRLKTRTVVEDAAKGRAQA